MNYDQIVAAALAALILAWPYAGNVLTYVRGKLAARGETPVPDYLQAVSDLAIVRARLDKTGHLSDEQLKAIDVLTLALVAGSGK